MLKSSCRSHEMRYLKYNIFLFAITECLNFGQEWHQQYSRTGSSQLVSSPGKLFGSDSWNLLGEGNGTPLQYSCLENPMDGRAWWAAVHGVTNSRKWLRDFTLTFHFHALEKEMATHSSVFAWRIPGTGEPGGLPSMGSHRVGHDWSDLAAAAAAWNLLWKGFIGDYETSRKGPRPKKSVLIK